MNFELGFTGGKCSRFPSLHVSAAVARISVRRAKGFSSIACDVLVRTIGCEMGVSIAIPITSPSLFLALFQSTRSEYNPRTIFWARILSDKFVRSTRGVSEPRSLAALLCIIVREFLVIADSLRSRSTTESGVLVKLVSPHLESETRRTSSVWTATERCTRDTSSRGRSHYRCTQ